MQWSLEERFDAIQSRAFRCHEISRERRKAHRPFYLLVY